MDNSIYVSLSRQMTLFRDMSMTANNIANADTPGYNAEKMMFTDYLVSDGNRHKIAFAQDIASYRDTSGGSMRVTGNPFDLAIQGPGYFAVETALGERYTKAGHFTIGGEGLLMTPAGNPVLDVDGQRMFFDAADRDIKVGENGIITARTPAGDLEERGQIGLFEFEDEQKMTRLHNQMYSTDQEPLEPVTARMLQGTLEGSNVSAISELVRSVELSRSVASTSKFVETVYDLQRKTSNTYAKSNG